MARGTDVIKLLRMVKAQMRETLDPAVTAKDQHYVELLDAKQKWFAAEFDWPFLSEEWDLTTAVATNNLPTTTRTGRTDTSINIDRPFRLAVWDNNEWVDVLPGIGPVQRTDYTETETYDPTFRYMLRDSAAGDSQIELWPAPASQQQLRFFGQRVPGALLTGADKADLDDLLLVLHVAAEELAAKNDPSARAKVS